MTYLHDSEVGSFLKHAPWEHTEMSASLNGPMVLTLKSKYRLDGGLVFSKNFRMKYKDCADILKKKPHRKNRDGVYTIYPEKGMKKKVFCDMTTDGGGWTVIQRRIDGSTDFNGKKWADYAEGFGNPAHEYWLGNDAIHVLTKSGKQKLRIDVARFSGAKGYATYSTFIVNNKSNKYKLKVGGYKGSPGIKDNLSSFSGMFFSTTDSDNDTWGGNCAAKYGNGWWHSACSPGSLNGKYYRKPTVATSAFTWYYWSHKNSYGLLKRAHMMIKPK
ncbi:ryncolin-2-like [Saccostrea echinata]|uniref:ryncolin-2-like n=1 Tax=Saccostrea echinata TaxID=191078 RepID=UPI002A821396|nr:ryncolin-2-like [Saccostrea echinata]